MFGNECNEVLTARLTKLSDISGKCPDGNVSKRFSTLLKGNTQAFLNQGNLSLQRFRPKDDKKTKELMEPVELMSMELMDIRQLTLRDGGGQFVCS